jgi:hypothetical protein
MDSRPYQIRQAQAQQAMLNHQNVGQGQAQAQSHDQESRHKIQEKKLKQFLMKQQTELDQFLAEQEE